MKQRYFSIPAFIAIALHATDLPAQDPASAETAAGKGKPNIIFILADDLGFGDLGCFGQSRIKTPNLDALAKGGMILTNFYSGSTVCAPSRAVLMTGQHTGRTWVRGNTGRDNREPQTLRAEDITVAEVLQQAGYATALCGKWGLGELGSTGHPNRKGFDYFYGYLNQRHAHNYYPVFLIRNEEKVPLRNKPDPRWIKEIEEKGFSDDGAGFASVKLDYSHDLIMEEALAWIDRVQPGPFFLYLAATIPHANNEAGQLLGNGQEVPDYGSYKKENWPDPDKGQAAMITRLDRDVGRLIKHLEKLGIAERTLVMFSSDNGPHKEGGNDLEFFDANGPLRGMKRDLYEGGVRVPTIAWWPGVIAPGSISNHPAYFGDFLATACEIAGEKVPADTQSISFLPTLQGRDQDQRKHEYLYWEFYEREGKQAVRFDNWKAIRMPMHDGKIELYDLSTDLAELFDVARAHPEVVARAEAYMKEAHAPNPNWGSPRN